VILSSAEPRTNFPKRRVAIQSGLTVICVSKAWCGQVPKSSSNGQTKSFRRLVDVATQLFHCPNCGPVALQQIYRERKRDGPERRDCHQSLQNRHGPVANAAQVYSQKVVPFNFIGTDDDGWISRAAAPRLRLGWSSCELLHQY